MKLRRKILCLLLIAFAVFALAACADVHISVSKSELTLKVGQSETLTAQVPDGAKVSWSTDNASVATVEDGLIAAVGEGTCTVTVHAAVGEEVYTADCAVTVTAAEVAEKTYTVETYRQKEDLTYERTDSKACSAAEGSVVYAEYAAAAEGYFLDEQKSVLSARLEEGTVLKVYYSLNRKSVSVERASGESVLWYVYENGIIADAQGDRADNFDELFSLTADGQARYYFWDIAGVKVRRALTENDFYNVPDGQAIKEKYTRDSLFNTAKFNNAVRLNGDGTYTVQPTAGWDTDTAAYLFFTVSSDTLYAKVTITTAQDFSDNSAGFVLVDSENMDKNVQFYLGSNGSNRILWQNNSFNWGDGTNRQLCQDASAIVESRENVLEMAVYDGVVRFWLNGNTFCEEKIADLTGPGNEAGLFSETEYFDIGIAQWRFNKPETVFSDVEFLYDGEAMQKIEARMLGLAKSETVIDMSDPSSTHLAVQKAEGMGPVTWKSDDESVVTVRDGILTPVGKGTATVTAEGTMDNQKYTASCRVTVNVWTVTFVAQGSTVKTVSVFNGGGLEPSEIPEIQDEGGYLSAEWDKSAEELSSIRSDMTVTAVYYTYRYRVTYYMQNAKTGDYQSYDYTDYLAQSAQVSFSPEIPENYVLNAQRSVLQGTAVSGEQLQLSVYFDPIVKSVNVSVTTDGLTEQYTAYFGLGLYDGEEAFADYDMFSEDGFVWEINGDIGKAVADKAYFSALLTDLSLVRHRGSMTIGADVRGVTLNEDGSIDTVSSGWTGAYAYFTGSGTAFYAQTTLRSRDKMDGGAADTDICAGFTVRGSDGSSFQFYLSFIYNSIRINYGHVWEGGDGNFGDTAAGSWIVSAPIPSVNFTEGEGAVVGLSYSGGLFRIIVDGTEIFRFEAADLHFVNGTVAMGDGWTVGLASWDNHRANFSDFYVLFEEPAESSES